MLDTDSNIFRDGYGFVNITIRCKHWMKWISPREGAPDFVPEGLLSLRVAGQVKGGLQDQVDRGIGPVDGPTRIISFTKRFGDPFAGAGNDGLLKLYGCREPFIFIVLRYFDKKRLFHGRGDLYGSEA